MGTVYIFGVIIQIIMSQILCYLIGFFIATAAFWFVRSNFLLMFLYSLQAFFGGIMLPPDFWTEKMQLEDNIVMIKNIFFYCYTSYISNITYKKDFFGYLLFALFIIAFRIIFADSIFQFTKTIGGKLAIHDIDI